MAKEHDSIYFQPNNQRNADRNAALSERKEPPELWVRWRIEGDFKLTRRHSFLDHPESSRDVGDLIGSKKAT